MTKIITMGLHESDVFDGRFEDKLGTAGSSTAVLEIGP